MNTDNSDKHGRSSVPCGPKLTPVKPMASGSGLPYAPENWPSPGDTWRWRVGVRTTNTGYYNDRYLYPPKHLPLDGHNIASMKGGVFRSRLMVERYIRTAFPKADVEAFFALFSWKIPCKTKHFSGKQEKRTPQRLPFKGSDEYSMHMICKAGNDKCDSLIPRGGEGPHIAAIMPCDFCCIEPDFCISCCCTLCWRPVSLEHGGYSFIRCEATVGDIYICGHIAHIKCALRAYMAGTVRGSIGLDAEYYCRHCEAKHDLVPIVDRFFEICQTVESEGNIEEILNLGVCMLRGSNRAKAKDLLDCIESTLIKLKCRTDLDRTDLDDTSNKKDALMISEICDNGESENSGANSLEEAEPIGTIAFSHEAEMHRLKEEVREVLQSLRKAQESEYLIAEARLSAQMERLDDLYSQFEKEKVELSRGILSTDATTLIKRSDQIKQEIAKLRDMGEVAKGFGRTPRGILKEYFHIRAEED